MFFIIYLLGFVDTILALPRLVEPYFLLRVTALFFCLEDIREARPAGTHFG
jgi:hypothetical protein